MAEQSETLKSRNNKGFTLVELAIVLIIVGMLVGVGSGMMGMLTTAIKVREAKELQDASVQSIISWASANNNIPNAAGFPTAAKTPQDSWGREFIYLYENRLYSASPTKDTICGRRSTDLTIQTTDPAATIANVAFVVISPSDDATVETTLTATAAPAVAATFNGAASGPAIALAARGSATGTIVVNANNTDIVRWVTLDELRSKVGCQGAPMKIINNELPYGYNGVAYSATVFADGGVKFTGGTGNYRWCIENTAGVVPAGMTFTSNIGAAAIPFNTDCLGLAEASWVLADNVLIGGAPTAIGSNTLTVYARDNNDTAGTNDNIANKPFVFTINPN